MENKEFVKKARTEERNPKTMNLDKMSTCQIIQAMQEENYVALQAIDKVVDDVTVACDKIAENMKKGGRLIYVGAGTSGRLGVLDAVECPPTFGVSPDLVVGLIAGGEKCMFRAAENAEDSAENGRADIEKYVLNQNDTIVGISANGNASYVIGAMEYAKEKGATAIALVNNPDMKMQKIADITVVVDTGAEVVTGSTRLKAGTSQKLVLNMFSTIAMIKLGNVYENLMINLKPTNLKLKERVISIVQQICHTEYEETVKYLEENQWQIRKAIENINKK